MPLALPTRWAVLLHSFFWITLLVFDPGVGLVHAQTQPQIAWAGKNILVLHAFESNVPIFVLTDSGLSAALDAGGVSTRNQFFEYLDLARNPGPEHRQLLAELLHLRYRHRPIDLIVTMYHESLDFLLNEGRLIFPDVPTVALYLPQGLALPETERRVIRHSASVDITGTLEMALKLVPGVKRVYFLSGAHEVDIKGEQKARRDLKKWEGWLEFTYLSHLPLDEILTTVAKAPPGTIVLILSFANDVTGRALTTKEVSRLVSRASAAPVFGALEVMLGEGIVGGSIISFEHIGTRTGELALAVLRDTKTADYFPRSLDVPPVPMFDWRQLRRWQLKEDALPEGSIVINKELTLWDFRVFLIGALAFILAQSALIAALLTNRRRRRSAEESLRQKSEELDQFFNVSLDLLCIANTDGYFLLLNPVWEKVLGYAHEELRAKRFLDFVHPDDLEPTRQALSALASQQHVSRFHNRYRSKDGSYRWLEWASVPAGNLIYAAARDLTERLKAQAEDQQRREELAHVSRIAMMGELTASLAHEINQPLTAILSNAQAAQRFLSQTPPDIGDVRQILDDIVRDNKRAGEVIRRVRALVKKEKPRQEPLDLNELIQQVVELVRGDSLLQGLSVATDLSPELVAIYGDGIQLQQVILNLILNRATAMRNAPLAQRRIIVRTAMTDNHTVRVSVTDFGVGIDENNSERLFEPFYTTKSDGLGMGLSISRTIVKGHGGTMEASNNKDGGATFAFTLPAHLG